MPLTSGTLGYVQINTSQNVHWYTGKQLMQCVIYTVLNRAW